jgi:hypothetical protein
MKKAALYEVKDDLSKFLRQAEKDPNRWHLTTKSEDFNREFDTTIGQDSWIGAQPSL